MDIKQALEIVVLGKNLSAGEMRGVMRQIMTGMATEAQIGGFLVALRMKGESIDEIAGAVEVMRELVTGVKVSGKGLVDIVGTGGDESNLFNVSTASTFVVAAAGGSVAKHGNRSVSSNSGAADVLEAAGVNLNLSPDQVALCVQELGVGFMFAPAHHSAMKHAIGPRKEMIVRTIFNLLGPLTNPAGAKRQLIGVYEAKWTRPVAEVLQAMGSEHVLVVHSNDGLDEISISAPTHVAELKDGAISEYEISPDTFGLLMTPLEDLVVSDSQQSLQKVNEALSGRGGASDIVAMNAGAAIYVSGQAKSLVAGVEMARDAIGAGLARERLKHFVEFTKQLVKAS